MKLEHQHQQHEAGTTTSTARSWNNIINSTKLEQQHHQQHEARITSSTARSWNINIYMWQQNEASASTTSVVL
jgi:hypothetical protein